MVVMLRNRRVSTSQCIMGSMEKAICEVKESMIESRSQVVPSSSTQVIQQGKPEFNTEEIVSAIVENNDLSDNEKVDACKVINFNPHFTKIYLALKLPHLQTKYLRNEVNELREIRYGVSRE